jgi:hypothetical protein
MKLIDVLNKIANGELKEGTKVKYGGVEYTYKKFDAEDDESKDLISGSSCSIFEDYFLTILEDEVELIEPERNVGSDKTIEPSKIEELDILEIEDSQNIDNLGLANSIGDLRNAIREIQHKINEVIRVINKE